MSKTFAPKASKIQKYLREQRTFIANGNHSVNLGINDNYNLSYDVSSGSEIMSCNKIDKPLVVYRFLGNVMTSITTLGT